MSAASSSGRADQIVEKRGQPTEEIAEELGTLQREVAKLREEIAALRRSGAGADLMGAHMGSQMGGTQGGGAQLPETVVVEADDQLGPQQGFYPLEHTEAGVPFCWTGPTAQFSFNVAVDRSSGADLQLDAINFIEFERQKNVLLLVDGVAVPVDVSYGGMGVVITADLPARMGNATANLVFILPAALSPANPADTRLLGLAFARLSVTPRA
jgi:hypothetical protein